MELNMDLRIGFDDEFSFGGSQSISCSSSSSSFSSASTAGSSHDPFTPTSGRSTPGMQPLLMDQEHVPCGTSAGFDLTPPASSFGGGYFPPDVKSELPSYVNCESISGSPSRKPSMQSNAIDFDCASIMSTSSSTMPTHGPVHTTHPYTLGHYPFAEHITSSPLGFPTPAYTLDNNACEVPASWAWSGDSPVAFFDRHDSPSLSSPVRDLALRDRNNLTPAYLQSPGRRRLCVGEIQQKTTALQRAQHDYRLNTKRERRDKRTLVNEHGFKVPVIEKGLFHCDHPDCIAAGRKPFKRQEHLKRHNWTCHNDNPDETNTHCPFCPRVFNRKDNWRQHLFLHTKDDRTVKRTKYHPDAKALYEAELKKTKQRSQSKKKLASILKPES